MLTWTSAATAAQVSGARALIRTYAEAGGLDGEMTGAVALAVTEALTNAVLHAFPGWPDGEGTMWLEAEFRDGELVVRICDNGVGMRKRDDSPGLGLGLVLIDRLARRTSTTYENPGGTRLTMHFAAGDPPTPSQDR